MISLIKMLLHAAIPTTANRRVPRLCAAGARLNCPLADPRRRYRDQWFSTLQLIQFLKLW